MVDQTQSHSIGMAALYKTRKARLDREQERSFLKTFVPLEQPQTSCPFSVHVLSASQPPKHLKQNEMQFEIETCNQVTGKIYNSSHSNQDFKLLRESLLIECPKCPDCSPFLHVIKDVKIPARSLLVLDHQRHGYSQAVELAQFLRDLLEMTVNHIQFCAKASTDLAQLVTSFLRISSALLQNPLLDDSDMFLPYQKTRKDRISIRDSAQREAGHKPTKETRHRGYSDPAQ